MIPAHRTLWIGAGVVAALVCVAVYEGETHDPVAPLTRVHATELPADPMRARWFNAAAKCIGIDTAYDAKLRYFVGDTIPAEWNAILEPGFTDGYTDPADHLVLLAHGFENDSTVVVHEQLHDYLQRGGHPANIFGDAVATHCGYRPGHD